MDTSDDDVRGIGLLGLIIIIALGIWAYHHFHSNYSKPWWKGSQEMIMCAVNQNNNKGCYTVPLVSDGTEVTTILWPNGGNESVGSTDCGKKSSGVGRYCDFTDSQGRDWEVEKY